MAAAGLARGGGKMGGGDPFSFSFFPAAVAEHAG